MNKALVAIGLAFVIATPAMAQDKEPMLAFG
jgi:hypothetical protein